LRVKYHNLNPLGVNGSFFDIVSSKDPSFNAVRPAFEMLGDWFVRVEVISGVTTLFSTDYWVCSICDYFKVRTVIGTF